MTAVLKIAVQDGVVMGTDSRSTIMHGKDKAQTFDGIQKLFVLHSDYPAAMMAWGMNRIKEQSVASLMKEATNRLAGRSKEHSDWKIDPATTTLQQISEQVTNFLFHDHYLPAVESGDQMLSLSLHFAGYSPGETLPEHVEYKLEGEHIHGPHAARNNHVQINFSGPYTTRLVTGIGPRLMEHAVKDGIEMEQLQKIVRDAGKSILRDMLNPGMPLPEVASLVRCLLNTEINLNRLGIEPDIVGGDIQMVVIDRYGCREMKFRPVDFQIPQSVWKYGNADR